MRTATIGVLSGFLGALLALGIINAATHSGGVVVTQRAHPSSDVMLI